VRVGLDWQVGVGDVVTVSEEELGLVQIRMQVGAGTGDAAKGGHVHVCGEGPHAKVVGIDHAWQ
jgi:hypothetical protein